MGEDIYCLPQSNCSTTIMPDYDNLSSSNDSIYDYDYDSSDSSHAIYWGELAPVLIVYSLTYIIGVTGNVLIIYTVLRFKRLKSPTNIFLISLSSADLILVLLCIPVKLARLFSYVWLMGEFVCKAVYYAHAVTAFCSVLTLVTISLERYYAIIYPMKVQYRCTVSKARRLSLLIWLLSFLLALPVLAVQIELDVSPYPDRHWPQCIRDFHSELLWPLYESYAITMLLVVPVCVMMVAYCRICSAVYSMVESRREMSSRQLSSSLQSGREDTNEIKQVVTMLVVVVTLFVVCWAPILIINVMKAYKLVPFVSLTMKHVVAAADLMSYANSCINPIIYGFMSRHFRQSFLKAVKCRPGGGQRRSFSHSRQFSTRLTTLRAQDTSHQCDLPTSSRRFSGDCHNTAL